MYAQTDSRGAQPECVGSCPPSVNTSLSWERRVSGGDTEATRLEGSSCGSYSGAPLCWTLTFDGAGGDDALGCAPVAPRHDAGLVQVGSQHHHLLQVLQRTRGAGAGGGGEGGGPLRRPRNRQGPRRERQGAAPDWTRTSSVHPGQSCLLSPQGLRQGEVSPVTPLLFFKLEARGEGGKAGLDAGPPAGQAEAPPWATAPPSAQDSPSSPLH